MTIVALVGCGKQKQEEPAPARELYTASYFAAKYEVAERIGEPYIYSAKYGLVHPDKVLPPYDLSMYDLTAAERREVGRAVASTLPVDTSVVVCLAGKMYSEPLQEALEGTETAVVTPFEGTRGIGEQLARMNEWMDAENTLDAVLNV